MRKDDLKIGYLVETKDREQWLVMNTQHETILVKEDGQWEPLNRLNKEIAVKIRNENQQLTSPTEKETLYFDAKKSIGFKINFNIIHFHLKEQLFDCHGLTKEETKERGYDWPSYFFTTEKPKPLKVIDGRVE